MSWLNTLHKFHSGNLFHYFWIYEILKSTSDLRFYTDKSNPFRKASASTPKVQEACEAVSNLHNNYRDVTLTKAPPLAAWAPPTKDVSVTHSHDAYGARTRRFGSSLPSHPVAALNRAAAPGCDSLPEGRTGMLTGVGQCSHNPGIAAPDQRPG